MNRLPMLSIHLIFMFRRTVSTKILIFRKGQGNLSQVNHEYFWLISYFADYKENIVCSGNQIKLITMITKVNIMWVILSILCCGVVAVPVSGTIDDDILFYYEELPAEPSKLATIDFRIWPSSDYVDFQLYTTTNHVNIERNCSFRLFSQVYNIFMQERFARIDCSDGCQLSRMIHDYIPRKFSFSLGFRCDDLKSLKGTRYKVEVVYQTNETSCSAMPDNILNCSRFYSLVSQPNLMGYDKERGPIELVAFLETLQRFQFPLNCYPHLEEYLCNLYLPQCDTESKSFVVPCRQIFEEMELGCVMVPEFFDIFRATPNNTGTFDNDYLPSRYGNIPCWYKPITCEAPLNTTDTVITGGLNESGIYYGGSELQYSCADESLGISGSSTVMCLHNGLWSDSPVCAKQDPGILLLILLPVLSCLAIFTLTIGIIIHCIKRRRKKAALSLTRRREFDAYVCYAFDQDDDFVMNTILPGLEENQNPPFKLCIHSRDFKPGDPIFDNIQKAISQSNSAIMIMSQAFVNSIWCKAEFEQRFIENLKDPAFKLFLIMMQPADT